MGPPRRIDPTTHRTMSEQDKSDIVSMIYQVRKWSSGVTMILIFNKNK